MFEKITFRGARYFGLFCPKPGRRIVSGNAHDDSDTMVHYWEAEAALTDKTADVTRICVVQTREVPERFRKLRDFPAELFGKWWREKRIADEERYMDAVLGALFEKSAAADPVPIPRVSVSIGIDGEHLHHDVDIGELIRQGIILDEHGQCALPLAEKRENARPPSLWDAKVEPGDPGILDPNPQFPERMEVGEPSPEVKELIDAFDTPPGDIPGRF